MLLNTIKQLHNEARKTGDKTKLSILTVVLGETETRQFSKGHAPTVTDEEVIKIIKKLIEDNLTLVAHKPEVLQENEILTNLLPKMASKEEIRAALSGSAGVTPRALVFPRESNISEGQYRGLAIKHLKSQGILADSKDVIEVVAEIFKEKQ